jgi:hypothetical protein
MERNYIYTNDPNFQDWGKAAKTPIEKAISMAERFVSYKDNGEIKTIVEDAMKMPKYVICINLDNNAYWDHPWSNNRVYINTRTARSTDTDLRNWGACWDNRAEYEGY